MGKQRPIDLSGFDEIVKTNKPKELDLSGFDEIVKKKEDFQRGYQFGSKPLSAGSKPSQTQVDTKAPSVLTPKGQVGYQEQVKDFKPIVQKPIFESPRAKQQRESGYENIAPLLSGLQSTVSSFYKIPRYIYDVFAIPQNLVADLANVPELKANYDNVSKGALNPLSYLEYAGDYTKGKAKEWESKQRKYDEDITTQLFKSGDYGGAGLQIYDNVIASAPSIAAMFLSGGVANAAKLGSASSKIATALPFASAQNQELLENQEIPDWLKPVNAAFNGLSEILLEGKFGTTAILSGATKIAAEKGADAAIKSTKDFVYNYIKKALSKVQPVTDVVSNAAEEMATTLSQNIIARATGEDPDRGIMDGVFDAGIVGGAQGAGASAIRKGLDVLANKKSKGKVDDLTKKRDDIVNDLDNDAISDAVKEQLEISLEGINQEINNTLDENRNEINNLPEETKLEVAELADKIETINESLQNETISETSKTILEQDLKDAQAELDAKFKLSKPTFDTEEQLVEEIRAAEKEFNETGDFAEYQLKINDLNTRLENLVPAPKDAEIGEPSQDQKLKDIQEGNTVTFTYANESEVPDVLKDKISSVSETNGVKQIRVTLAKSEADYLLKPQEAPTIDALKDVKSEAKPLEVSQQEKQAIQPKGKTVFIPNIQINAPLYDKPQHVEGASVWEGEANNDGTYNIYPNRNNENRGILLNNRELSILPLFVEGNSYSKNANKLIVAKPAKIKVENGKVTQVVEKGEIYYNEIPKKVETIKPQEDAIQVETAGQVPVLTEAPVGEEVEQGKPQAKDKVVTEEGKEEINPIDKDKGFDNPDFISYNGMFSKEKATSISQTDIIADEVQGAKGYHFFYKGKKSRIEMMSPDEYLKRVREGFKTNKDENILDSSKANINEGVEKGDKIDMPSLDYSNNSFNQEGRNRSLFAKERGEKLIPVLIIEDASMADRIAKAKEILSSVKTKENTTESLIQEAKNKFNLHRDAVEFMRRNIDEIKPELVQEKTPAQEVKRLRAKEQAELNAAIPNADQYLTNGKVDRDKLTDPKDLDKFDDIYDKYDKLITPLLPKSETKAGSVGAEGEVEFTAKGGNKVVDEKGNPLVLYHGTSKGLQAEDLKQSGQAGDYGEGIYFATDKREAEQRNAENIIEANVKSDKHLVIGSKEYFDGIYKTLEKKYGSVIPQYAIGAEAKKAGYTSIEVERPEGKWIIAFDGSKIQSLKETPQAEPTPAKPKAEPRLKPRVETRIKFTKAIELFNDISAADGAAKKGTLARKRQKFLAQNPSIKYIDDNWRKISDQLKAKGLIETKGNCP